MNRTRRAIGAACLAVVALLGCSVHTSESASKPTPKRTSVVSDFNDGFATSKQDDCQQGFKPACKWLSENR
ncbi:hypothetical protein ACFVYF_18975 [Streptomyces sp. NPDC058274]|uniref:hypothetical protein n=1 Tax=Streptomyces sp. NPDC058274 TaxID=3346416 RepID=UPI0036EE6663